MSKNKIPPDLIAAARDGHLDICEELLKRGASVDAEDRRGEFEAEHNTYIYFIFVKYFHQHGSTLYITLCTFL